MNLQVSFSSLASVAADWLVVGLWQEQPLAGAAEQLNGALGGSLQRLLETKDITGKANELTTLYDCPGIQARRLTVVGLGQVEKADMRSLIAAAGAAGRAAAAKELQSFAMAIPQPAGEFTWEQMTVAAGVGLLAGCEGPELRKSKPERFVPKQIQLVAPEDSPRKDIERATAVAAVEAKAVSLARELVNTPPCDLYPETFAARAESMAKTVGIECEIFDEKRLTEEGMGALLGVAQGSEKPPRLAILRYRGGTEEAMTLGLVGKGVTFDSGGLSLKPSDAMLDMKCDMAGAAAVTGAMQAIAELKLPVNAIGVLALVENMPSGKALKLGDVLQARNGKTIEIHNTDAEGRLILADALAYTVDQKVNHLIDLATLTGACVVALGTEVTGLMSNNDAWSDIVRTAAQRAGEYVWPLPMFPLYNEMIKSNVADMKNTGGKRWAGAISAAKLLEEFVDDVPWVHLDIAGPAWADSDSASQASGGTGVMVRTLVEVARQYSSAA